MGYRNSEVKLSMSELILLGILCVMIAGYLTYALLKPEKF